MQSLNKKSASFPTSLVRRERKLTSFGGNDEKIKNLLKKLEEMLNKNLNSEKMKEIKLVDGIPSTRIQKTSESIRNILDGLHNHNASRIYSIINEDIELEIIKNKLIDELFLAFKYTLVNNRYGDLLSDNEMKNAVKDYVNKYVLIKK